MFDILFFSEQRKPFPREWMSSMIDKLDIQSVSQLSCVMAVFLMASLNTSYTNFFRSVVNNYYFII